MEYVLVPDNGYIVDSIILISSDTRVSLLPSTFIMLNGITSDQILRATFKPDATDAVNNLTRIETEIFPNPAQDDLNIGLSGLTDCTDLNLSIFNNLGRIVYKKSILSNETSIDLKSFSKSVYIIRISDNNAILLTKTLVIE